MCKVSVIMATAFSIYNTLARILCGEATFGSLRVASAPGIEPWHPAQVAENLVRNRVGSLGDVAGEDVLAP